MRRSFVRVLVAVAATGSVGPSFVMGSSLAGGEPPSLLGPRIVLTSTPTTPRPSAVPAPTAEPIKEPQAAAEPSSQGSEPRVASPVVAPSVALPREAASAGAGPDPIAAPPLVTAPIVTLPPPAASMSAEAPVSETAPSVPVVETLDEFAAPPTRPGAKPASRTAGATPIQNAGPGAAHNAGPGAAQNAGPGAAQNAAQRQAQTTPDGAAAPEGRKSRRRPPPPTPILGAQAFAYQQGAPARPARPRADDETPDDFRNDCGVSRGKLTGTGPFGVCVLN